MGRLRREQPHHPSDPDRLRICHWLTESADHSTPIPAPVSIGVSISSIFRTLLGVVTLALAAGLLAAVRPAEAESRQPSSRVLSPIPPDGAGTVPSFRYEYRQLSKAKRKDAEAAVKIIRNSVSNKGKTLHYQKANKYDKGRTTQAPGRCRARHGCRDRRSGRGSDRHLAGLQPQRVDLLHVISSPIGLIIAAHPQS